MISEYFKRCFLLEVKLNVFLAVYGLKCYKCASTKSWDDCVSLEKETTCPTGFDRCLKGYVHFKDDGANVEGFEKACLTAALCDSTDKIDLCKGDGRECDINCCSGDLCNAAALQLVSVTVLTACALVALLH